MKKIAALLLTAGLCMGVFVACNKGEETPRLPANSADGESIEESGPNLEEIYALLPDIGTAEYADDTQGYRIEGYDAGYMTWSADEGSYGVPGWIYFANPDFAGDYFLACRKIPQGIEGGARWFNEEMTVVEVSFSQSSAYVESGTVAGSDVLFRVDLSTGELIYAKLVLMPDVPYVISDEEMVSIGKTFARLLLDAHFYFWEHGVG